MQVHAAPGDEFMDRLAMRESLHKLSGFEPRGQKLLEEGIHMHPRLATDNPKMRLLPLPVLKLLKEVAHVWLRTP